MINGIKKAARTGIRKIRALQLATRFLLKPSTFLLFESVLKPQSAKSQRTIMREQICHILKYGEVDRFYFCYGRDSKDRKSEHYMPYSVFMEERNKRNNTTPFSYVCLLRDKNLFGILCKSLGIPTPGGELVLKKGEIFTPAGASIGLFSSILDNNASYFVKAQDGECGSGVYDVECCPSIGGVKP